MILPVLLLVAGPIAAFPRQKREDATTTIVTDSTMTTATTTSALDSTTTWTATPTETSTTTAPTTSTAVTETTTPGVWPYGPCPWLPCPYPAAARPFLPPYPMPLVWGPGDLPAYGPYGSVVPGLLGPVGLLGRPYWIIRRG
uniref:Secreted protein n=1 Tax=Haemonchus contortus TaxID=6289 RepID=A0A7I4YJH7_HAECO